MLILYISKGLRASVESASQLNESIYPRYRSQRIIAKYGITSLAFMLATLRWTEASDVPKCRKRPRAGISRVEAITSIKSYKVMV
jgi:hypothetical protein